MIRVEPFTPSDLPTLAIQPGQQRELIEISPDTLTAGPAWTVRDHVGRALCCAGFQQVHAGHAIGWALLAGEQRAAMVALTRRVALELGRAPWRRVTAMCRADWNAAHRWLGHLGFACEGVLSAYGPEGDDYAVYGRVRRG